MVCHVNTTSATTTAELNPLRAAFTGRPYRTKAHTSIHLPAHPRSSPRLANRIRCQSESDKSPASHESTSSRRDFLIRPAVLLSASFLLQHTMGAGAEESTKAPATTPTSAAPVTEGEKNKKKEDAAPATPADISSRIYDATAIGEPLAVGKDKGKVWDKLLAARIVYLGEAELVPDRDDRALELEIVRNLRNRCFEQKRPVSLALEIFPSDQQDKLNLFMQKKINGETLQSYNPHWPPQLWQEYEPLLNYCRDNGVRLVACGTPLEVLRIVQAEGIRGLPKSQRKQYAPPAGSGFISGFSGFSSRSTKDLLSSNQSVPFAPSSYLSIQARVVDDYSMSQMIFKAMSEGGSVGMLLVITGASHVMYGSRGVGIPARISKKLQKKNQAVILLDPERQHIRREGEAPVADFLWYSAAKTCSRNCFDRAEIARVMNAAGRRRDALPQDLQQGLDLGVVSPEILQNFFDLEKYPLISELIHRFQGFRERLLVDPKFLHRLAIEEAISITTTLLAQYERRKERFFEEIDYVLTDTIRGSVVDFFTVWLPAPTVSFISSEDIPVPENLEVLKGLIGSIPDNAFQKVITGGKDWTTNQRLASVIVGGLKLAGVGFISSIGAASASGVLFAVRRFVNPAASVGKQKKQTPLLKAATVYGCFLGTSANLRYQIIAGIVEHRLSDQLLTFNNGALLANALSFVVRTVNSYWGTQQWIDLARLTGLQPRKTVVSSDQVLNSTDSTALTLGPSQADASKNVDEINNQSGDNPT